MTKTFCDNCGQELDWPNYRTIVINDQNTLTLKRYDWCKICVQDVFEQQVGQ